MDRRDILVLKPNVGVYRMRGKHLDKNIPMLNKRLLCKSFLTTVDAINYAIKVKQRYLKLKEHECTNPLTI